MKRARTRARSRWWRFPRLTGKWLMANLLYHAPGAMSTVVHVPNVISFFRCNTAKIELHGHRRDHDSKLHGYRRDSDVE